MKYHFLIILISLIKLSYNLPNDQIYELNDFTFDYLISEGKKYRWLILFYLSTCGHCEHAKEEILKIYKNYSETNIRFAKMEIQKSWTASLRFNISGVPYIILVENNKIYELQKYPNDKNLIEFLNTSFNDVKDEIVDFPKQMNLFNVIWGIFSQYVRGLREYISLAIYYYTGIEYEVQPSQIFVGGIFFMIIFGLIEYWLLSLCFGNDDEKKDNIEKKEEEKKEDNKLNQLNNNNKDTKENLNSDSLKEEKKNENENLKENDIEEKKNINEKNKVYNENGKNKEKIE